MSGPLKSNPLGKKIEIDFKMTAELSAFVWRVLQPERPIRGKVIVVEVFFVTNSGKNEADLGESDEIVKSL